MIIGSIVYATQSGLGTLAKTLYQTKVIDKVFIAEHPKFSQQEGWYKKEDICHSKRDLVNSCDVILLLEAPLPDPFDWSILSEAKSLGKKVVLIPMYESTPRGSLHLCDTIICPSDLDKMYYEGGNVLSHPMPTSPEVKWARRKIAHKFVHNVGHGGIFSRNGTVEILKALPLIHSQDIEIVLRVQPDAQGELIDLVSKIEDPRVTVEKRNVPFEELWAPEAGDVFLFPEKFNGLSLPLQEAFASGMMVMAGDRFPINQWLPKSPLIPVKGYFTTDLPWIGIKIQNAVIQPIDIATTIDRWSNRNISDLSFLGRPFLEKNNIVANSLRTRILYD